MLVIVAEAPEGLGKDDTLLGPGLAVEAFDRNEELIKEPKDLAGEAFMDDACDGDADAEAVGDEEY